MTPSEKEKIIKEGFDAIRKVYNLRDDLLSDAGKLEAARESNRKLSDRVANLEVTIRSLNSAIDKKDVEIHRLNNRLKATENSRDTIYDNYLERFRTCNANKAIMRQMIADNRKKKDEIKRLKGELELLRKAHAKLCRDYNALSKTTVTEANFHELRERIRKLGLWYVHGALEFKDLTSFSDWFENTFGDFGIYDDEKK